MFNIDFSNVNISRFLCFRGRKQENLNTEPVQNIALRALSLSIEVNQAQPLHVISRNVDSPYQDFKMKIYLDHGLLIHNAAFNSITLSLGPF